MTVRVTTRKSVRDFEAGEVGFVVSVLAFALFCLGYAYRHAQVLEADALCREFPEQCRTWAPLASDPDPRAVEVLR